MDAQQDRVEDEQRRGKEDNEWDMRREARGQETWLRRCDLVDEKPNVVGREEGWWLRIGGYWGGEAAERELGVEE